MEAGLRLGIPRVGDVMDPIATYLLSVMKREETDITRRYIECQFALSELGYWCLSRPAGYPKEKMPATKISEECRLVESFPIRSAYLNVSGVCVYFDAIIDVYEDLEVTQDAVFC